MPAADLCVARSRDPSGELVVQVGVPLADVYLEFLGGRCRPNTVLAAAYDLKVFFAVVAKPPDQVRPADVLAFITAQRTGRAGERCFFLQPVIACLGILQVVLARAGQRQAAAASQVRA